MDKPVVFLSHSSRDRTQLAALKNLLDEHAAGSLNLFLSSDGESIRFGRNWVVTVADALKKAQLMFVFLSAHSADSKWVHFEAGYAYGQGLEVVPVCLPGMDLDRMTPPLSLLQGFNLHSHQAMGNIARICNQKLDLKIKEAFSEVEFAQAFAESIEESRGFFGGWASFITQIHIGSECTLAIDASSPTAILRDLCHAKNVQYTQYEENVGTRRPREHFETAGCHITIRFGEQLGQSVSVSLAPQLFDTNAMLLDAWRVEARLDGAWHVSIIFRDNIATEKYRPNLTTRLLDSGIHVVSQTEFEFQGFRFIVSFTQPAQLLFKVHQGLSDARLSEIVKRFFTHRIFTEAAIQPEWFEQ